MANDGVFGIESSGVEQAKSDLEAAKTNLCNWLEEANGVANQVVEGWDAAASTQFAESYAGIDADMQTMCTAVEGFKNWADETQEAYRLLDANQTSSMEALR